MRHSQGNYFVAVSDAINLIIRTIKAGPVTTINTALASGRVVAETIKSPYPSPPFDQSAMDGYAFRFIDMAGKKIIRVVGEAAAGKNFPRKLKSGECVRIFTGATVPPGADTVVMQEKVNVTAGILTFNDAVPAKFSNVRKTGSHVNKNEVAIRKNTCLNPGSVGFLASLGIKTVKVYKSPSIAVIVTGDELIMPGKILLPGQIYESNSATLLSVLNSDGIFNVKVYRIKDNLAATKAGFRKAALTNDFVLFTGGISVGDYDYVGQALKEEKVKTIFYKVKQKPGKPLFFGKNNNTYVFALPGNPASVLTCYYEFVRPAIKKFQNNPDVLAVSLNLPLTKDVIKKSGLTHFLKAVTDFKTVTPLPGQESYKMKSFTAANCLIILDEKSENPTAGSIVEVHLI